MLLEQAGLEPILSLQLSRVFLQGFRRPGQDWHQDCGSMGSFQLVKICRKE